MSLKNLLPLSTLLGILVLSLHSCCHGNNDNTTLGDGTCPNACPIGAICDNTTCNCPEGQYVNTTYCEPIPSGYSQGIAAGESCGYDNFVFKVYLLYPQYSYPNDANAEISSPQLGQIDAYYQIDAIRGDTFFTVPAWALTPSCVIGSDTLYPQWAGRYTLDKDSVRLSIHWTDYSMNNTGQVHRTVIYNCKVNN